MKKSEMRRWGRSRHWQRPGCRQILPRFNFQGNQRRSGWRRRGCVASARGVQGCTGPKTHLRVDFCSFTALWPAGFEPFTVPSRQPSAKPTRAELAGHRPELQSSRLQLPQQPKEGRKVQKKKKKENPEIYTFRNFLCSAWVAQP
ncbi:PREDICTED: uncharacterized protein LOC105595941 [Cercocebus atys]|uniref:uncharacterized protein LOC105595941 n=1 Tax=Cercocebus atys TaxID=9531 RepID=UPI0005F429EE|nr:PREDICTED: uncharacterized protein LOC105595941 [Cercocebus atys]